MNGMLIGVLDDETNLEELEANVRAIEKDGLVWGASKWVPLAYAIQKLQINLVVEDEKVSTDELQQQIEEDEDHVQSTDVVSFRGFPSNTDCHADFPSSRLLCRSCNRDDAFYEEWRDDGYFF